MSVQGNEVKPLQPRASVDGPLSLCLFLSLPPSFFLSFFLSFYLTTHTHTHTHTHTRTHKQTHWHKHIALPFSNISCPLRFLWMHFNRYKNSLTHTQENGSFQIFSAYTKTYCPRKCFRSDSWITQIISSPNGKMRIVCWFSSLAVRFVCFLACCPCLLCTHYESPRVRNRQLQQCWGVECQWLTRLPSYESHDSLSESLKATHS